VVDDQAGEPFVFRRRIARSEVLDVERRDSQLVLARQRRRFPLQTAGDRGERLRDRDLVVGEVLRQHTDR